MRRITGNDIIIANQFQEDTATQTSSSHNAHTKGAVSLLGTLCLLFFSLVYWESFIRIAAGFPLFSPWPFLFLAALSALFAFIITLFSGAAKRVCTLFLMVLLQIYYGTQLVYFRIFGSMLSVSMLGMGGDAVANFGWALRHTMLESAWLILLLCAPTFAYIIRLIVRKAQAASCAFFIKATPLLLAFVLWFSAAAALALGSTGRFTAYDAYYNSLTDTDTASAKLGILPTTVIESFGDALGRSDRSSEVLSSHPPASPGVFEDNQSLSGGNDHANQDESSNNSQDAQDAVIDTSPNIIAAIDFEKLEQMTDDEDIKTLCRYFAGIEGANRNQCTGLLEGYNLIYICAESFSPAAVHPELTPTLYRLSTEGIILNNYYNSFMNTTTNGEFAFMTGLWPDVSRDAAKGAHSGSFIQSAENWMPYGLGNIFNALSVKSFAYHNYFGEYYNRKVTHSNLGYTCRFMDEGMSFTSYWPASDLEMMQQSVDEYIDQERFNVYYMTFSAHGPYSDENSICGRNIAAVDRLIPSDQYGYNARYYLAANLELELAMQHLMQRLEEAGKAENTLIVLTGDHYPYYLSNGAFDELTGADTEPVFGYYKSNCIMWCGGLEEPIVTDTYCCNVDILPTVLNLLGIEYDSRLLAGRDIFSDGEHTAVLYDKSFLNENVWYEAPYRHPMWQADISAIDEYQLNEYISFTSDTIDARYAASLMIVDTDFYRFVWENSGLMPEGYVPPASSED